MRELIKLRALEPDDIDFVFETENDQGNWRVSNNLIPYSRYEIEQFVLNSEHDLMKQGQIRFIVQDIQSSERVGIADLFMEDSHNMRAGIGVIILDKFQNRGYGKESLFKIIDFAFNIHGLHQLYCHIHIDNPRSIKLFEACGFQQSGLIRDWFYFGGQFSDVYFYQLINPKSKL